MKKAITISILALAITGCALPAIAGQSHGGKPFLPGDEIVLGGQSHGGKPFVGGELFSVSGFVMDSYTGYGMGLAYWEPGFFYGYGYEPYYPWPRGRFGFDFMGIGFGCGFMDFLGIVFDLDFFLM